MKKFLIILVFILAFTSASCSSSPVREGDSSVLPNSQEPSASEGFMINRNVMYLTFEETIALATNIVKAQFQSITDCGNYYEYKFLIETQIKGNIEEEYLYVYSDKNVQITVPEKGIVFDNQENYTVGTSYILILERHVSVYYDHDRYLVLSGTFFPTEDMSAFRIYGNETLNAHSQLKSINTNDLQSFTNYISTEVSKNPLKESNYYGTPYITDENIKDIVSGSNYVVRLIPKEQVRTFADNRTAIYQCELVKQYKGTIVVSSIDVKFVLGTVSVDNEYIVALNDSAVKDLYIISSKSSVMNVDKENEILKVIGEVE